MNGWLDRFIDFLIRARWPLFAAALVLAALAWWPANQVRFDRSIENMFAPGDPLLPPYERLKRDFGGNEIVVAVYRDPGLLLTDGSGVDRLAEVSRRMADVPGVKAVLSLAQVNDLLTQLEKGKNLGGLLDLFSGSKKKWTGPAILNPDSPLAARYRELFAGYTHSTDGQVAAVVCMLEPTAASQPLTPDPSPARGEGSEGDSAASAADPRAATIQALETIVRDLPADLSPGVLAGEPVMVARGFALLEIDGQRLGLWSTVLLGLTILVCFRSLRWLIVPIAVVQWSLIVTRAALVLSGLRLSMVSSMLTAIVTVVGVATVMHLIVHFREYRTQGLSPRDSLFKAGVLLAGPIVGAILTDMAGFGSLWWASVGPVRDFGTMMVVGSLLVLPAVCLLVPAIALAFSRNQAATQAGWGERQLGQWLMHSVDLLRARPKAIAAVLVVVCGLAAVGAMRLEVETDFTRNFRSGSSIVESYAFVETHLGGAGVWDVVIPAPATLDNKYLDRVRHLEQRLRALETPTSARSASEGVSTRSVSEGPRPALTKVISLVDAIDVLEADKTLAALTPSAEIRAQGLAAAMPVFLGALRKTELDEQGQGRLRIMLRAPERQPAEQKRRLIEEVTRIAREEFPGLEATHSPPSPLAGEGLGVRGNAGAEVTGFFVLLTNLIESMLRDQWTTFAIASGAIALLVLIGFRSWKYALIGLVPNAVPIYVVMGLMGWLNLTGLADLKINMGSAMIAAVSMGMSVDSSIHYFAAFRRARRAGKSVHAALYEVQQSVGSAMIFSTIALVVGFGVLITSDFVPTIYFGALMCLAMLGGMLGNLIVLPLLLSWTERDAEPLKSES